MYKKMEVVCQKNRKTKNKIMDGKKEVKNGKNINCKK
jgi:hypothetical protein